MVGVHHCTVVHMWPNLVPRTQKKWKTSAWGHTRRWSACPVNTLELTCRTTTDLYNNWIGGPASQADPTGSRLAAMLKHPKNIFAYSRKTTCVAVSTANFSDFFDFFSFRKGKLFVGWQSVAGMPSCAAYGCTNREERNKREKNTTFHRYVFLYFYS